MTPKFVYYVFYCEKDPILDIFAMPVIEGKHFPEDGWALKVDRDCATSQVNAKTPWLYEVFDFYKWLDLGYNCYCYYTINKEDAYKEFINKMSAMSNKIYKLQEEAIEINKAMFLAYKKKEEMDKLLEWCDKLEEE